MFIAMKNSYSRDVLAGAIGKFQLQLNNNQPDIF